MKYGIVGILMLFSTITCAAAEIELLLPATGGHFAESTPGHYPVKVNLEALQLAPGDEVKLTLSGASHAVVYERSTRHENGDVIWVGYLKEKGDDYRVIITRGAAGSFGRILTPDGEFALQPGDGMEVLVDRQRAGHKAAPVGDDVYIPTDMTFSPAQPQAAPQNTFADAGTNVEIDLMILYTPGMVKRYPGSALQTRLNHLVGLANQGYIDSQVGITLRLVHSAQVEYSETTTNKDALNALLEGSDPALSGVAALRAQQGADMVTLMRPYNDATAGGSGGIAALGGAQGSDISKYASQAFSVVGDGDDTGGTSNYVSEYTLTHELGHNMGCEHDRANADAKLDANGNITHTGVLRVGAYPYSYGYGKKGEFGTIMSYISPRIGKFSNPAITCNGQPCGIVETAPDAANNALSLNNTRAAIANFRLSKEKITEKAADYTVNADGTVLHKTTGLIWKRCSEGQAWTGVDCSGTAKWYTWDQAMALGANGWGLPTKEQLRTIVDSSTKNPAINTTIFPNTPPSAFWSASAYAGYSDSAWYVYFYSGYDGYGYEAFAFQVRLVRGGQSVGTSATLYALSLTCPATLAAGTSGTCNATTTYSDKTSKAVSPTWSSSNTAALAVSGGTLTGAKVTVDTPVTVSASYTESGIEQKASATVTVKTGTMSVPAGIVTGAITAQNISVGIAPASSDQGKPGGVFIFAIVPGNTAGGGYYFMDGDNNWLHFTDCSTAPIFSKGALAPISGIKLLKSPADLSSLRGTEIHLGYGLGALTSPAGTACDDMMNRGNFSLAYTIN